jgi:hypothetical protein
MFFHHEAFHTAVVVDDLVSYTEHLIRHDGVDFANPVEAVCYFRWPNGNETEHLIRSRWGRGAAPWLEVSQAMPGSIWQASTGIHHVGVWTSDLEKSTRQFASVGGTVEISGSIGKDEDCSFRYMIMPGNMRVELVSTAMREYMEDMCGVRS